MKIIFLTSIRLILSLLVLSDYFASPVHATADVPISEPTQTEVKKVDDRSVQVKEVAQKQTQQATAVKSDASNILSPTHPFVQALRNAYATNPDLHAAIRQQFVTVETLNQAYAGWRPNINVTVTQNFQNTSTDGNQINGANTILDPTNVPQKFAVNTRDPNTSTTTRLDLTQNLFNGWQTLNGIDQAKNTVLAGEATVVDNEQQLLLKAIQSYLNMWQAKKTLELRIVSERFNKSNFELLSAEADVGEKTSIDSAESEASYATAVAARLQAEADLEDAYAKYIQVIGKEPPANLTSPPNMLLNYPLPKTINDLSQRAQYSNPTVLTALYTMKAAEFAMNVADGKLLPSLNANATGIRAFSRDGTGQNITQRQFTRTNQGILGLALTVPIYQAGTEWSGIRSAAQTYYLNKNKYLSAKRSIIQQVQTTWKAWKSAEKSIDQYKIAVKAYELNREGKLEEYKVGTITLTDTLRAENQLVEAQVNLINAEQKYLSLGYQLMALYGDLLPESLNLPITRYQVEEYDDSVKTKIFGAGDLYKGLELEKVPADAPIEPLDVEEGVTKRYSNVNQDVADQHKPLTVE